MFGETVAASDAMKGRLVGWFAPEYKRIAESYNVIAESLLPAKLTSSKTEGRIRTVFGGGVDFWSLEDDNAGRGRKYHRVVIDEGAFAKPKAIETWQRAIEPTLTDYDGAAIVMSNTNGVDQDNLLWQLCNQPEHGFVDCHAPTMANPLLPLIKAGEAFDAWRERRRRYFEELRASRPPLVYQQEFLAEFVDWSGAAFFAREKMLVGGEPVPWPHVCEAVFAVLDTATKTGKEHDGSGVVYYALCRNPPHLVAGEGVPGPAYNVVVLDWDLVQIEGAILDTFLRTVFERLAALAGECRARVGSIGAMIEDKASGMILLQQAQRRGWPAHPIDSKLTALGKDERAISVSGYYHQGMMKISRLAYDKVTMYKGASRNHFLGQMVDFRVGDKTSGREDDLLDCGTYGLAIACGNAEGF